MKENLVSLAKLLATDDAFNLAFSSRGTDEEKYELAKTKFTDLTREDFSEFLKKLRETEKVNLTELFPDELEMVAGGVGGWATKLAAATMLITTLGATGVMSQQADAMKRHHPGSPSGQASTHGGDAPRSAFTPVAPVMFKVITQPTQPDINQFIQRQVPARDLNIIKLMTPRSGEVIYEFNNGEKTAQKIFEEHHKLNLDGGSSYLIGELAQIVESLLWKRRELPKEDRGEAIKLGGITFKFGLWGSDIIADKCGSYKYLITSMVDSGSATRKNAGQILKNLSKPCLHPPGISENSNGQGGFDYNLVDFGFDFAKGFHSDFVDKLADELFKELDEESKKLVAVLLCESIRFNDDGAFARWSIREIIGGCRDKKLGESHIEYEKMYTATKTEEGQDNSAIALFAPKGGKAITINFINNEATRKVDGSSEKAEKKLGHTKGKMENYKQYGSPATSPRKDRESLNEEHNPLMTTQEENGSDELSYIFPTQDGEMPSAELPGCQTN